MTIKPATTDVKSAARTLELFELFALAQQPLTLTQISGELGAPLSSCYALVRSLEARGYLYNAGDRKHIYPTRKLFDFMKTIIDAEPWVADFESDIVALRDKTQETAILARIQGNHAILLFVAESHQRVRVTARAGDQEVLHATSLGKALLSGLAKPERMKLLGKIQLEPLTPETITDRADLARQLEEAAELGYAVTRGEYISDASSIAAPLRIGGDLCAIGIVGPTNRLLANSNQHLRDIGRFVQKAQGGLDPPIAKWMECRGLDARPGKSSE